MKVKIPIRKYFFRHCSKLDAQKNLLKLSDGFDKMLSKFVSAKVLKGEYPMDEKDWALFKKKLNDKTGIDLQLYKEPQMKRRIGNLVNRSEFKSFTAYFDSVVKNKESFAEFIVRI